MWVQRGARRIELDPEAARVTLRPARGQLFRHAAVMLGCAALAAVAGATGAIRHFDAQSWSLGVVWAILAFTYVGMALSPRLRRVTVDGDGLILDGKRHSLGEATFAFAVHDEWVRRQRVPIGRATLRVGGREVRLLEVGQTEFHLGQRLVDGLQAIQAGDAAEGTHILVEALESVVPSSRHLLALTALIIVAPAIALAVTRR